MKDPNPNPAELFFNSYDTTFFETEQLHFDPQRLQIYSKLDSIIDYSLLNFLREVSLKYMLLTA
jgi:hypothetical protein